MQASESLAVYR